jgi:hypothetical protein
MKEKIIKQKIVYSYSKDGGYYAGEAIAYQNPLEKEKYLIPANSTDKKPIIKKGHRAKWDGTDWILEKDNEPDLINAAKTIDDLILEKIQELEIYFNSEEARKFIFLHQGKNYTLINSDSIRNLLTRKIIVFGKKIKIEKSSDQFTLNLYGKEILVLNFDDIKNLLSQLEDSRQRQFYRKEEHKSKIKSLTEKEVVKNYNFKS